MIYTSTGFEEQAASDLKQAQANAMANQSGNVLGMAMFCAQQSMEKRLKSIVLKLDEELKIGLDEKFYKKRLGHAVYSRPKELYLRCFKAIGFPRGLDDRGALESARQGLYEDIKVGYDYLEKLGETWQPRFFDRHTQELLMQHSLRVPLPDSELKELDRYIRKVLDKVYKDTGFSVHVSRFGNKEPSAGMVSIISDSRLLEGSRRLYAERDQLVIELSNNENLFMSGVLKVKKIRGELKAGEVSPKDAKRLVGVEVVEYAIPSLARFSSPYLRTYPHHELGRYPQKLSSGKMTTDIYAAQRNDVLYELFVVADYNHTRMSYVSKHVDDFCRIYNNVG